MQCCVCKKKPATVHLTEIKGDQVQKMDLCEACAEAKGVDGPNFALADSSPGPVASHEVKFSPDMVVALELMKFPTAVAIAELIAARHKHQQLSGWLLKSQPSTN